MKRHRVQLRPKLQGRRRSAYRALGGALALAAALGFLAAARPWRNLRLPGPVAVNLPKAAAVDSLAVSGAPEPLERAIREAVGWSPGQRWGPFRAARLRKALAEGFPCASSVSLRRSWLRRSVEIAVELRRPLARVERAGKPLGYLSAEGLVFPAPEGLFAGDSSAVVELGTLAEDAALEALGGVVLAAAGPGALPAPLASLRYEGEAAQWSGTLEDGTVIRWGRLDWTQEKLRRLREVFADARPRFPAPLTADLSHFEDGKILVRPR